MTVGFCGHSRLYNDYDKIKYRCYEVVREQIAIGANCFLIGDYGDFDGIAAAVCLSLKKEYPHVEVCFVQPYYKPHIDDYTKQRYDKFDAIITPLLEGTPPRYRIVKANRYMVEQSDILIAYVRSSGGAAKTLEYAYRKGKKIFNLAEKI